MKIVALLFLALFALRSYAFPDMVRHGYTTCVTCHFSPSGGGSLNPYGKYIAGELFGAYNTSVDALPWLTEPTDEPKYSASILARAAQTYLDTPKLRQTRFIRMQLDLEVGLIRGPYYAFITGGIRGSSAREGQEETDLKLRTFFVGHGSVNHAIRVGRFYPEYGIRTANHTTPTRKGLYWNQGDEPYIAQASYYTTTFDYNFAYLMGAPETQLAEKVGFSGSLVYKTATTRTGFSALDMSNGAGRTHSRSLFTQLGYYEKGYTMIEGAVKFNSQQNAKDAQTNLLYLESGWEVKKGIIPYVGVQRTHVLTAKTVSTATPVGLRFYPITHSELILEVAPTTVESERSKDKMLFGFAMFNVYF